VKESVHNGVNIHLVSFEKSAFEVHVNVNVIVKCKYILTCKTS